MTSILSLNTGIKVAPRLNYFEMPNTQMDQTDSKPPSKLLDIQSIFPPLTSSNESDPQDHTSLSSSEYLINQRIHLSETSSQLGSQLAQPEPVLHKRFSPIKSESTSRSLDAPFLHLSHIATNPDSKPTDGRIEASHTKEAVTSDLG